MRKSRIYMLMAALALPLMGCNMDTDPGSYSFHAVHIYGWDEWNKNAGRDVEIKSWRDVEMGIEVNTEDYGAMFLSEGTYILLSRIGYCPICR